MKISESNNNFIKGLLKKELNLFFKGILEEEIPWVVALKRKERGENEIDD